MDTFVSLLKRVRACEICADKLPLGPRPIVQMHPESKILIVSQAPGSIAHASGVPFNDPSGRRLRRWMGITESDFYQAKHVAIVPMGFCYPGKGKSGDLPPRPECAPAWRDKVLQSLNNVQLTLFIGQYAQQYHLGQNAKNLSERVANWRAYWPNKQVPLPHPSPRNNPWFTKNPWFEEELVPALQKRVSSILTIKAP